MIHVENLTKTFGHQILFDRVDFKINQGERIGMVGRNGHGKTTLLRILAGEESFDEGRVNIPKQYRIGIVRQELVFHSPTVIEECIRDTPHGEDGSQWKVEKILSGLGFSPTDMERHPSALSGGFQVRLSLAKALAAEPDLLLLDEPTNFLDITSIRWVEKYLKTWPRELILITHDRGFMDAVVTHVMGIHRRRIRKLAGDTGKYYFQIAQEEDVHEKTRLNDERRRRDVELFIRRFRAKARLANMVQSRIKSLNKLETRNRLEKLKELDFSFRSKPYTGKHVLKIEHLRFGYPDSPPLIHDLSITMNAGERIGVIGKNGKGKTTLLKLLCGERSPTGGTIVFNPGIVSGAFVQGDKACLSADRTIEEEIMNAHPDVNRQMARTICGAMLFEGDAALKRMAVLSGGEKSRVMLGRLLATPVNFLLLDEPTNHLDMESCDALLSALDRFDGTIVMVTHNEMFLHALTDRLIVFQGEKPHVFDGGYAYFLEKEGWLGETESFARNAEPASFIATDMKSNRKEIRRRRSEIVARRSRLLNPLQEKIQRLENRIDEEEKNLSACHADMQTAVMENNGARIAEIARRIHRVEEAIRLGFDEFEALNHELEKQREAFEKELAEIDGVDSD